MVVVGQKWTCLDGILIVKIRGRCNENNQVSVGIYARRLHLIVLHCIWAMPFFSGYLFGVN